MENIKCVCIGDGAVGKTSLLISYTSNQFPVDYVPTTFDNYRSNCVVDGRPTSIGLWDTAGQEDYDNIRPMTYADTDVFLVCYAVDSPTSLENVVAKWVPELRHYCPDAPFVLLGTRSDKRKRGVRKRKSSKPKPAVSFVHPREAQKVGNELGAAGIMECSAKNPDSLCHIFDEIVKIGFKTKRPPKKKRNRCVIL